MEIKIKLWEVLDGTIRRIKIYGDPDFEGIYSVERITDSNSVHIQKPSEENYVEILPSYRLGNQKGGKLKILGSVPIYCNILREVKIAYATGMDIKEVIEAWYPEMKPRSIDKYVWAYRKELGLINPIRKPKFSAIVRGDVVATVGHNHIYANILKDFNEALEKGNSLKRVFKKYSPEAKKSTLTTYVSLYKRYLKQIKNVNVKSKSIKQKQITPFDAIGYDSTYATWVRRDEAEKVLRACRLVEFEYEPTSKGIISRTDLAKNRVMATIHFLIKQGRIKKKIGSMGNYIYQEASQFKKNLSDGDAEEIILEILNYGNFTVDEIRQRSGFTDKRTRELLNQLADKKRVQLNFDGTGQTVYRRLS